MTSGDLSELLRILRESGVTDYITPELTLKFGPPLETKPVTEVAPGEGIDADFEGAGPPDDADAGDDEDPAYFLERIHKANHANQQVRR